MKRIDYRILIGVALVILGGLMLLERLGVFRGAMNLFWGVVLIAGAAYFVYRFVRDPRAEWWAAIPGFTLAGLSAESLLPGSLGALHGLFFLGGVALGFFAVYLSDRRRWWAIIPGGVMLTLALISVVARTVGGQETGGLLFVGLGVTFLLVAVLAAKRWAYVPGVILLAFGALLGTSAGGTMGLLWPAALIAAGLFLILQFVLKH